MSSVKQRHILIAVFSVIFVFLLVNVCYRISYASWIEDENGIHYKNEDGEFVTGFYEIDNETYYFSKVGNLLKGKFYVEDLGAYYYGDEKGVIQYGVIDDGNHFYITDGTGKIKTGFVDYNQQRYYFDESAELKCGWFKDADSWYYANGYGQVMVGFVNVDGYRYYLSEEGKRVSDTVMNIDGTTYVFNKDGSVNENATYLYPWIRNINEERTSHGLSELTINTKVQACAILRATDLVNGYINDKKNQTLERLLNDRGVSASGGYEFSYGGIKGYTMDQLLEDIKKDDKFTQALLDESVTDVGVGIYEQDNIQYYDVIFVRK
ncbi:MAG: CAP domain-containing protein [Lachnospiraceae bacterium]